MVIGITGGMGSGKTTFVKELAAMGARVVDADSLAKKIIEENASVRYELKKTFGSDVFDSDGHLKRRLLAQKAFAGRLRCRRLNRIVWPRLIQQLRTEIGSIQKRHPDAWIVLDMAVLFESGADALVDRTVTVSALKETRTARVKRKLGLSVKEINQRMRMQMPDSEKRKRADTVIRNNDSILQLRQKARVYWRSLSSGI